jgi:Uma2 family endonuclease
MTAIIQSPDSPQLPPDVYRFTVDQFDRMVRDGTIDEDEPVELLDGLLVLKMGRNKPHKVSVRRLAKALARVLPPNWLVSLQDSIVIGAFSEPEPDGAVLPSILADDTSVEDQGSDCVLVVEISDLTLPKDRGPRQLIYAQARIPVYWIVNLIDRQVEVYTTPLPDGYQSREDYIPGQDVPVVINGNGLGRIPVTELLPSQRLWLDCRCKDDRLAG